LQAISSGAKKKQKRQNKTETDHRESQIFVIFEIILSYANLSTSIAYKQSYWANSRAERHRFQPVCLLTGKSGTLV